ncbi:MAG: cytochrome-c oxidase, cbb3-type subunit III [Pseudomonadales bacterium]
MSTFWSAWIIVLTVFSIAATLWLLLANRKSKGTGPGKVTGHAYDGIDEYDNPLPAWWMYMFLATIVFSIGYLLVYPGLGNYPGIFGWSQVSQLEQQVEKAEQKYGPLFAKYADMPVPEVLQHKQAVKMGQRVFANNCAQCHGSDGKGSMGFPNLTDQDWLYGGTVEQIKETIVNGRAAAMPPWQDALKDKGIDQVAAHVLALSGREADPTLVEAGQKHYQTLCVACHGADGKGNPALGAPNLTDDVWLYGGSPLMIKHTLRSGRNGRMPAFKDTLSADKIHLLNAYVYGLSKQG